MRYFSISHSKGLNGRLLHVYNGSTIMYKASGTSSQVSIDIDVEVFVCIASNISFGLDFCLRLLELEIRVTF